MIDAMPDARGRGSVARPSISAIVATRDRAELLRRAVRAILAQRYDGRIEVLVVFAGSRTADLGIDPPPRRSVPAGIEIVSDADGRAVRRSVGDRLIRFEDLLRSRVQELHPSSFLARRAGRYLLERYPEFAWSPRGLARLRGRVAFAYAAMGDRAQARRWTFSSLAASPVERRAYLALLVSTGIVPAAPLARAANRTGRGI
jgi:hypothetical protein